MKRILILILVIVSINQSMGQITELQYRPPKNVLKTNFLPMLWGPIPFTSEYRIVYERAFFEQQSFQFGISYLGASPIKIDSLTNNVKLKTNGVRVQLAFKHYFKNTAPKGFYISPQFSFSYAKFVNVEDPFDYLEAKYINGVILFGYQLIADDVFALDMFAGGGYKNNIWKYSDPADTNFSDRENISGPKFVLGFNLGIAF